MVTSSSIHSEYFLHYVWRTKQIDYSALRLTDGRACEIIDFGQYNTDSGPDFLHGRVRIDGTLFAGHIELHNKTSDWLLHRHHEDKAYNSVILHVVGHHDCDVHNQNNQAIATIELNDRIDSQLKERYAAILSVHTWIPCQNLHPWKVPPLVWTIWKERLNVERIVEKTKWIDRLPADGARDWFGIFFRQLFRAFGTNVNREAFEELAVRLDYKLILRNLHETDHVFALIFGMAGFLEQDFKEDYPTRLKTLFGYLKQKYSLIPLEKTMWKYARMHPPNFPDVRLAQIATLLTTKEPHMVALLNRWNYHLLMDWLEIDLTDTYWEQHFILDQPSKRRNKSFSKEMKHLILINACVPFMFYYGNALHMPDLQENALNMLFKLPPEHNHIITGWEEIGIPVNSASDSQALLNLKKHYCDQHQCLKCSIGHSLLKV